MLIFAQNFYYGIPRLYTFHHLPLLFLYSQNELNDRHSLLNILGVPPRILVVINQNQRLKKKNIFLLYKKPTEHLRRKFDTVGGAAHFRPFDCRRKCKRIKKSIIFVIIAIDIYFDFIFSPSNPVRRNTTRVRDRTYKKEKVNLG